MTAMETETEKATAPTTMATTTMARVAAEQERYSLITKRRNSQSLFFHVLGAEHVRVEPLLELAGDVRRGR